MGVELLGVASQGEVLRVTHLWGASYGPGSARQRPHDRGGPSSATSRSEESIRAFARRHGISPTTVQKWRKRETVADVQWVPRSHTLRRVEFAVQHPAHWMGQFSVETTIVSVQAKICSQLTKS